MASTRKRLPDVAIGYAKLAHDESERARKLSQQATEAAQRQDNQAAATLSAQAEAASTNAKHYAWLAANPDKAP